MNRTIEQRRASAIEILEYKLMRMVMRYIEELYAPGGCAWKFDNQDYLKDAIERLKDGEDPDVILLEILTAE